jgi:ubiquinone/menaquinone biosynthesis C-methylase UbiE
MTLQNKIFRDSEGDAWFVRNPKEASSQARLLAGAVQALGFKPTRILEIGCAGGAPLNVLQQTFDCECFGIDPSGEAVEYAKSTFPDISCKVGTADNIEYGDNEFDLVVLGFCLYLTDPEHHFRAAWQIDRVLRDKGAVVIKDFLPPAAYKNAYAHRSGIFARKMPWSDMLLWHPSYSLLSRTYMEHGEPFTFAPDERVGIDILYKDTGVAFPDRPREFADR